MRLHTFMKSGLLFICLLSFVISNRSLAQSAAKNDIIVKRDSSRIQALITQMSYEKINYRDLGTADSAKSYIYLDKVARVILKTGKIIHVRDSVLIGHVPPDSVGQYADMANLPTNKFERDVVMANSDQLRDKYRYHTDRSIDGKTGAIVFTSFAAASLISGVIIAGSGTSPDNKTIGNSLAIAGPVVGVGLGLIGFRNYKFHRNRAEKVKTELVRRNQSLTIINFAPSLDPFNKSAQLTLRMSL
ncbi:hypothetical protein [Dyadobacter sp. CY326]|uniref:hypothetical protein n=1 Tax=Dyadobacter sp. CY326 TaxID=2907300 RepID=UPI001F169359|nr:hypothetical protein [Dyadobacter sp. CY326]MCE7068627.1 hypothetical protein [Dyadobacter sp. CY326]